MVGLIFPHLHQHHDQIFSDHAIHNNNNSNNGNNSITTPALGVGVGVIPLLSTANAVQESQSREEIHLWQNRSNCLKKPAAIGIGSSGGGIFNFNSSNSIPTISGIGTTTATATTTCRDCGNQAKKDCSHGRCRTCCKSRGFDCSTHVKSTWIPVARRRERHISATAAAATDGSSASTSAAKKARVISLQTPTAYSHTSNSNNTPPRSFDTSSSQQDAGFRDNLPGHVHAPAVFKCVRVTAIDNGEDEYAYQAMVKIKGHVFKGFLYDQGLERRSDGVLPDISDLHLGGPGTRINGVVSSSSPLLDHLDIYAASGNQMVGAMAYGNTMN